LEKEPCEIASEYRNNPFIRAKIDSLLKNMSRNDGNKSARTTKEFTHSGMHSPTFREEYIHKRL